MKRTKKNCRTYPTTLTPRTFSTFQLISNVTPEEWAQHAFDLIDDTSTSNDYEFYGAHFYAVEDKGTAHLSVIAPNGDAVSSTSTINTL